MRASGGATARLLISAYEPQDTVFAPAFALLQNAITERVFPAASVAITQKGKLVARKAFGRFTYEPDASETTPDSIFDLASVTKIVATTSMAMILYELGLLDLDMPAVAMVPEFAADNPRNPEVTMRMLLTHSSGLPAYEKLFLEAKNREDSAGRGFRYSAHRRSGHTRGIQRHRLHHSRGCARTHRRRAARQFLPARGLRPFGDAAHGVSSAGGLARLDSANRRRPRIPPARHSGRGVGRKCQRHGRSRRHAGLFATAEDVAIFANAMLEGGRPILRPETLAVFTRRESSPPGTTRALGWDTPSSPSQSGKYFSAGSFGHLGYTGTSLWIDPERQLSVTLLTNRTWPDCR